MPRLSVPVFMATRPFKKFNGYKPLHPYRILLPPMLKDRTQNRNLLEKSTSCVDEMSNMMACWKEHEFSPETCLAEMIKYNKCVRDTAAATKELKEKMRSGKVKTKGRFTSDTVNEMLKKFPQPPHTIFPK